MWTTRLLGRAINQWQMEPRCVLLIDFSSFYYFLSVLLPPVCCPPGWKGSGGGSGGFLPAWLLAHLPSPLHPGCWERGRRSQHPSVEPGAGSGTGLEPSTGFWGAIEAGGRGGMGLEEGRSQLWPKTPFGISGTTLPHPSQQLPTPSSSLSPFCPCFSSSLPPAAPGWDLGICQVPGRGHRGCAGSVPRDTLHPAAP